MLVAHKFLDAAWSRGQCKVRAPAGVDLKSLTSLCTTVSCAEKFDFGDLHFEKSDDAEGENRYELPEITADERDFWLDGLIPLPAPVCLFEYNLGSGRVCLIVRSEGDDWSCQRIDFFPEQKEFFLDGTILYAQLSEQPRDVRKWIVRIGGNPEALKIVGYKKLGLDADFSLSIYLTLMINSRSTEIVADRAPPKLTKARQKRGEQPLFDHRVVRIVPENYRTASIAETKGTHASPRLHWRRSHLRHLPNKEKPIVIPRCLVGRADIGAVSHEYRIG